MPSCSNGQVTVTAVSAPEGAGAGHTAVLLLFTNKSTTACSLYGYPGVDGLNASGASIAHASRTLNGYLAGCGCGSPSTVSLEPGQVASAQVEGYAGNCPTFAALLVTPPNTSESTKVAATPQSCGLTVHPVVAGSTGLAQNAGYLAARQQWQQGSSAISAAQAHYWLQAAADLQSAVNSGVGLSSYQTSIAELKQLASLPETSDTPTQQAEAHTDVAALNVFFQTPGLYG